MVVHQKKHCNQLLVPVTHAAAMEVILMARRAGRGERQVCEVIGSGAGGSEYFKLPSSSVIDNTAAPSEFRTQIMNE